MGLDIPFRISCTHTNETEFRLYTTLYCIGSDYRNENDKTPTIYARPAGTHKSRITSGPMTLTISYKTGNYARYKDHISYDALLNMAIGQIPGSHMDRPLYGLYVVGPSTKVWLLDLVSAPLPFVLQPESVSILQGSPPTPIDIQDLDVVSSLRLDEEYAPDAGSKRVVGKVKGSRKGKEKAKEQASVSAAPSTNNLPSAMSSSVLVKEWDMVSFQSRPLSHLTDILQLYFNLQTAEQVSLTVSHSRTLLIFRRSTTHSGHLSRPWQSR